MGDKAEGSKKGIVSRNLLEAGKWYCQIKLG